MTSSSSKVLEELRLAERHALQALELLTAETEYLRLELEEHLSRLRVLFAKMADEKALIRDRDFLLSDPPAEGVLEWLGGNDDERGE